MRKRVTGFGMANAAFMTGLMLITIYPFWYMLNISFSSEFYVIRNEVWFWPRGFTLMWYKEVFLDGRIGAGYRNTIAYTAVGTVLSLIITSLGAFALSQQKMMFRKPLLLAIVFTILFSGGMIPSFLVAKQVGILDSIWSIVLPGAVSTFHLLVFRTFFQSIPEPLYDAGKVDGLQDFGLFIRIVVPLSKPVYAAIGLFQAVALWNDFYKPILYLKSPDKFPLTIVMRDLIIQGTLSARPGAQSAADASMLLSDSLKFATIMASTLPILLLYPFLQKYFVKGVLLGSVKE
ncbi:carbohydrate ABC transporter permease [Paenibacillus sp. HB172176]|uniref:carbohydrate ABC transporter permease n=1 Tax=Paenibacillus sp. HB172176 TaxID=2493690 RepID=UPI001438E946|nr:carbohydrate ABC transporter permease [Paenibacillus sp. HB172176]